MRLVIDLATLAAELDDADTSMEAVRRMTQTGPPPKNVNFQSGLLGGADPSAMRTVSPFSRPGAIAPQSLVPIANLVKLIDLWQTRKFDQQKIIETLRSIVLPESRPNEVFLYAELPPNQDNPYSIFGNYSTMATPYVRPCIAWTLIDLAHANSQLDGIITELDKRSKSLQGAAAIPLLVYAHRIQGKVDLAASQIENLIKGGQLPSVDADMIVCASMRALPQDGAQTSSSDETKKKPSLVEAFALGFVPVPMPVGETESDSNSDHSKASNLLPRETEHKLILTALRNNAVASVPWMFQVAKRYINANDHQHFVQLLDGLSEMTDSSINNASMKDYVLQRTLDGLSTACTMRKRPILALEVARRLQTARASSTSNRSSTSVRPQLSLPVLCELARLPIDQRYPLAKSLTLEAPLLGRDCFSLLSIPDVAVPEFAAKAGDNVKDRILGWPTSHVASVLDLLLNDAETKGELGIVIDELLAKTENNNELRKLLCEWIAMRSHYRKTALSESVSKAMKALPDDSKFAEWLLEQPTICAQEIMIFRRATNRVPEGLKGDTAFETNRLRRSELRALLESPVEKLNPRQFKYWVSGSEGITSGQSLLFTLSSPGWSISDGKTLQATNYPLTPLLCTIPMEGDLTIEMRGTDPQHACPSGIYQGVYLGIDLRNSDNTARKPLIFSNHHAGPTNTIQATVSIAEAPETHVKLTRAKGVISLVVNDNEIVRCSPVDDRFPFSGLTVSSLFTKVHDVKFSGDVKIPRQVNMLTESLVGWTGQRYNRSLPPVDRKLYLETPTDSASDSIFPSEAPSSPWKFSDGELTSNAEYQYAKSADSLEARKDFAHLAYQRPLAPGDRIDYEMMIDSKTQPAALCVGPFAYVIQEGRIRLRWMVNAWDEPIYAIPKTMSSTRPTQNNWPL